MGILIRITLNHLNYVGDMDILTIIVISVFKHGASFHLFISYLIFNHVLQSSKYRSFNFLVKFAPTYFILDVL